MEGSSADKSTKLATLSDKGSIVFDLLSNVSSQTHLFTDEMNKQE